MTSPKFYENYYIGMFLALNPTHRGMATYFKRQHLQTSSTITLPALADAPGLRPRRLCTKLPRSRPVSPPSNSLINNQPHHKNLPSTPRRYGSNTTLSSTASSSRDLESPASTEAAHKMVNTAINCAELQSTANPLSSIHPPNL